MPFSFLSSLRESNLHPLLNGVVVLLLVWLVGLFLFTADVSAQKEGLGADVRQVDGLVALTGGTERIAAGLDLLASHLAPRLMISGVDPRADTGDLVPAAHPATALRACCITFGTYAEDTIGNAREAAAWAHNFNMKSLVVVTSNYHIRRALMEFHQAMPDVILVPYVVTADHVHVEQWWNYPGTSALMIAEYNKLLLAFLKAGLHMLFKS